MRAPRVQWTNITGRIDLLQEFAFRRFWLARIASHSAGNAVLYAFLILVVERTGSTFQSGLLVVSYILPTAALGAVSGAVVDHLPKGLTLFAANLARAALMLVLLFFGDSVPIIYVVALLLAVAAQFITPAEQSGLPLIVRRHELVAANSVNNFGALASQVVGMAILAPAFLATVGPRPLYAVTMFLYAIGAFLFATVPNLGGLKTSEQAVRSIRDVRNQFARAWQRLMQDVGAYMAVIIGVLTNATALVVVALAPKFVVNVLDVPARNAIFIFAPAAVGILAALRLVALLTKRVSAAWLVGVAFGALVGALILLGLVGQVGDLLPLPEDAGLIIATMIFSAIAAFAYTVITVASRATVNQRMPLEIQGRIFAAQVVLINLASIPPILLTGALAEWLGVTRVLILIAVVVAAIATWIGAQMAVRQPVSA